MEECNQVILSGRKTMLPMEEQYRLLFAFCGIYRREILYLNSVWINFVE
jgi:hypothetical protein